jgi:hypothetical protein
MKALKSDLFTLALEADWSMAAVAVHSLIESTEAFWEKEEGRQVYGFGC